MLSSSKSEIILCLISYIATEDDVYKGILISFLQMNFCSLFVLFTSSSMTTSSIIGEITDFTSQPKGKCKQNASMVLNIFCYSYLQYNYQTGKFLQLVEGKIKINYVIHTAYTRGEGEHLAFNFQMLQVFCGVMRVLRLHNTYYCLSTRYVCTKTKVSNLIVNSHSLFQMAIASGFI